MAIFTEFVNENGDEPGISLGQLGRAVMAWAWMQEEQQTVATAAMTFNARPEDIRLALDETMWVSWTGPKDDPTKQLIEHDGE
jgi:hypothetical protein